MARTIKLSEVDQCEEVVADFLKLLAAGLDETLVDAGVTRLKTRRRVVDDFVLGLAGMLDEKWFESDGTKYFPFLAFADRHRERKVTALMALHRELSHSDSAFGVFDGATNRGKGPYTPRMGEVGEDEATEWENSPR